MPTPAQAKAVERYSVDVWGKGDLDAVDDIFHSDYVRHGVILEGEFRDGTNGLRELVTLYRTAMPDMQVPVEEMGGDGDVVFTRWRATGTNTGPILGADPTGKSCDVIGFWMHRFDGDKVAEEWATWDTHLFLQQIGLTTA